MRQRACDLPLDDEIGAHQPAGRVVEEPVQDRRSAVERRVGEHAVRRGGKRKLADVARVDGDGVGVGEAPGQAGGEHGVDLDRAHARPAVEERGGEGAGAGAELDDVIGRRDPGVGRKARRERRAFEEVLSELSTVPPPGVRPPGHGTPSPLSSPHLSRAGRPGVHRISVLPSA